MPKVIKEMQIKQEDGSFDTAVFGVHADNISTSSGASLTETLSDLSQFSGSANWQEITDIELSSANQSYGTKINAYTNGNLIFIIKTGAAATGSIDLTGNPELIATLPEKYQALYTTKNLEFFPSDTTGRRMGISALVFEELTVEGNKIYWRGAGVQTFSHNVTILYPIKNLTE